MWGKQNVEKSASFLFSLWFAFIYGYCENAIITVHCKQQWDYTYQCSHVHNECYDEDHLRRCNPGETRYVIKSCAERN